MATDVNVNLEGIAEEYTKEEEKIDDSFYTKSMDLSDQDFEFSEELEQEKKNKIKVLIEEYKILSQKDNKSLNTSI